MKKRSDIDMIIKYKEQRGLMDLVRLQFELEEKLGRKVDILTYNSLHPLLKKIILSEQKTIYILESIEIIGEATKNLLLITKRGIPESNGVKLLGCAIN